MSRCFNWFPIGGLGEPYLYQNLGFFSRNGKVVEKECVSYKYLHLTGNDYEGWCKMYGFQERR